MRITTTTELEVIRKEPFKFTWGRILKIIDVGPYVLVHYVNKPLGNSPGGDEAFHLYVDGKSTNSSYRTLDGALVAGTAFRNCDNYNEARWAAIMAARILNIRDEG